MEKQAQSPTRKRRMAFSLLVLAIPIIGAIINSLLSSTFERSLGARMEDPELVEELPSDPLSLWALVKSDGKLRMLALGKLAYIQGKPDPVKYVREKISLPGFAELCRHLEKQNDFVALADLISKTSTIMMLDDDAKAHLHSLLGHPRKIISYLALSRLAKDDPKAMESYLNGKTYEQLPANFRRVFMDDPFIRIIRNQCFTAELERYLLFFERRKTNKDESFENPAWLLESTYFSGRPIEYDYYNMEKPGIFPVFAEGMRILDKHSIDSIESGLPYIISLSYVAGREEIQLVTDRFLKYPTDMNRMAVLLVLFRYNFDQIKIPDSFDRLKYVSMLLDPELPEGVEYSTLDEYQSFYGKNGPDIFRKCQKRIKEESDLVLPAEKVQEKPIDDITDDEFQKYFPPTKYH